MLSSAPWGAQPHRQHPARSRGWVLYGCSVLGWCLGGSEAGGDDVSLLPHSWDAPGQQPVQVQGLGLNPPLKETAV